MGEELTLPVWKSHEQEILVGGRNTVLISRFTIEHSQEEHGGTAIF